jgi:glutamyl-Q tRNA(Asp) synthetase
MTTYTGRFAPSPSGPLHFGSLLAALGSYLRAKAENGRWLLRIDDIDPPREPTGASAEIIHTLSGFGFAHDGAIIFQRQRLARYQQVLSALQARGLAFPCHCSRSAVAANPSGLHRGRCAGTGYAAPSWRLLMPDTLIEFDDLRHGTQQQYPAQACGDLVLWRSDGWPSYMLANVVDDADFGITEVVRGDDLLDSTARQLSLIAMLNWPKPRYLHLPLALATNGQKLSKQNGAAAVHADVPEPEKIAQLTQAWQALGQAPIKKNSALKINLQDWFTEAIATFKIQSLPVPQRMP